MSLELIRIGRIGYKLVLEGKPMTIFSTFVLAFAALSAEAEMPKDFLKVESEAWSRWLDEETNTGWKNVPLKDVLDGAFGAADLSIDKEKKLDTPITFDAEKLSRRAALWHLGQKYGFEVHWTQKKEPEKFLDLLETEEENRTVGGIRLTVKTCVMRSDYETYLQLKRDGKIRHEKRIGETIYYSYDLDRDLHFENGTRAHVSATQRYKTTAPKEKTPPESKTNS